MNNRRKIFAAILMLALMQGAGAQTYDVVERRNFWNGGNNAAGLRMDSVTVSYAELYGRYEGGDFRDYSGADKSWSAGAIAKTIVHTDKYSMAGSFSFDNTSGKNMSGSMFTEPGYYPIDVLEFTPGRKELQTYAFTGGISGDVAGNWRLGANIGFTSSNYSKRKDLRYTNYRMDLTVSPGTMYHNGNTAIGLNYIFGKNFERVRAEEIGTSGPTYYAFLDKGLMYGAYEAWTGSGVHLSESGMNGLPVKEITNGVAVQVQHGAFFTEMEYLYRSGSVGEKQTIWFEFPTHGIKARIGYSLKSPGKLQLLKLNISWTHQVNNENELYRQTENGITITRILASNRVFERNGFTVNPEYEYISSVWELATGYEMSATELQATQMYPYVMSQDMTRHRIYLSGILHKGVFDVKAGAAFATGNFKDKTRTVDTTTGAGDPPYRLTDYYNLQNEYLTATRIIIDAALRYNFFKGMYCEFAAGYTRVFDLEYITGNDRWFTTFKMGYNF